MNIILGKTCSIKVILRVALPSAILAMTAGSAYAFDFSKLNVSDFATPEQATTSLKTAGFNIDDLSAYQSLADGKPVTLNFPYVDKNGATVNKAYSFKTIDDLKAQAKTIAQDYQKLTKDGGKFDLTTIKSTVVLPNGQTVEIATQKGSNDIILKSPISGLNGKVNTKILKEKAASIVSEVNNGSGLGNKSGNPASHVSQMSYYDSTLDANGVAAGNLSGTDSKSSFNSNLRFANYTNNRTTAQLYTLSLGYNLELGNGLGVLFNIPLTYVDNDASNNESYRTSIGAGIRLPVSRYLNLGAIKWDVIPLVRVGGVGLGSGFGNNTSVAYSGGLQSNMGGSLGNGTSLIIQNQYTYNTDASQYTLYGNTPKDVNVNVYRNGLQLNQDLGVQLFGKPLTTGFSFADVRFDSNMGGIDNQQEFGFNFGLKGASAAANLMRLNLTYTNANGYDDAIAVSIGGTY